MLRYYTFYGGIMHKYVLLLPALSIACTDVKSSSINTDGMYLNYSVVTEGEGSGATADVILRVGGITSTTYVDLAEGDRLLIDVEDESEVLSQQTLGVLHSYNAVFTTDTSDTDFTLNFERVDLDAAPSSVATLPDPFVVTAPEADTVISRSDDMAELVITWDSESEEEISIEVQGDCFEPYIETGVVDTGSYVFPVSYFADHEYDGLSSCEASVIVERRRVGVLDSNFGEGSVYGAQRRMVTVQIEP
jgi:hypothetical protein